MERERSNKEFFIEQFYSTQNLLLWYYYKIDETDKSLTPPHDELSMEIFPEHHTPGKSNMGNWSSNRILFHLLYHEENVIIPNIRIWYGEPAPVKYSAASESWAWNANIKTEELVQKYKSLRMALVTMLDEFEDLQLHEYKPGTEWGAVSLEFVLSKALQHTVEHLNKIMKHAIFWKPSLNFLREGAILAMRDGKQFSDNVIRALKL